MANKEPVIQVKGLYVHATGQLKLTGAGSGKVINHATAAKNVNRSIGIKAENPGEEKP